VRANLLFDNASIHRAKLVREFCVRHETTLNYLPPYCPWYNLAEYAFSTSSVSLDKASHQKTLKGCEYCAITVYGTIVCPCQVSMGQGQGMSGDSQPSEHP
jgi:hypothetical protein